MKRYSCFLTAIVLLLCLCVPCAAEEYAVAPEDSLIHEALAAGDYSAAASYLSKQLTLREKICQLMIVTPEMLSGETLTYAWSDALEAGLQRLPAGGVILFGQNISDADALMDLNARMDTFSRRGTGIGLFLAITEEGGDVSPLSLKLGLEQLPPSAYLNAGNAAAQGEKLAGRLAEFGFNMDLCPCADLYADEGNAEIGERAYSYDAYAAADCAALISAALEANGVVSVYKHFPGIGSVEDALTRRGKGTIPENMAEMKARALIPYYAAVMQGCAMIQVSAMDSAALDPDVPCCLSPAVVGMLRNDLGYEGVIMTDSMRSALITEKYGAGSAAVMAVEAGCDVILLSDDPDKAVDALVSAVQEGRIPQARIEESVQRVLTVKLRFSLYSDVY